MPTGPVARSRQICRTAALSPTPLVAYGQLVVEALAAQVARTPSLVVLADAAGVILCCQGDAAFMAEAALMDLQVGADWGEVARGANAISTSLVEGVALAVAGSEPEHFLAGHRALAGVAAPILVPSATPAHCPAVPLGTLALFYPASALSAHALALVEVHAGFIEDRLIESHPLAAIVIRLHPVVEALESPLSGLLVFTAEGRLVGRNSRCGTLVPSALVAGEPFASGFSSAWALVVDNAGRDDQTPLPLLTVDGGRLQARISRRPGSVAPLPEVATARCLDDLGSDDPRISEAIRRAGRIVDCDIPLLIQGETGSGKEWFAQAFHHSGSRCQGPFVAVNCAAIPATLIEAELFGYNEGAFTGTSRLGTRGKIREADGGTLFLDEIGDMPLSLQAVLLRVTETRRVTLCGKDSDEPVDIRLVCASHQPLCDLVAQGTFRADLFFRLSGMTVALPPLRERSDFTTVVRRILAEESPHQPIRLDPEAFAMLRRYNWPGNLRQLRNVLRLSIALLGNDNVLLPIHLPSEVHPDDSAVADAGLRAGQGRLTRECVDRHGGNITAAARELGISRTTLYRILDMEKKRLAPPPAQAAE